MRTLRPSLACFILLLCGKTMAAPPSFTAIQPRSAQPGKALTVILNGANLTPSTRFSLPFAAEQKHLPDAKHNPAQIRLEVTVGKDVEPGFYPVRLVNEEGLSALALFRIDTVAIGAEIEDNNTFDKAQKIAWPIAVEGQCAGGDVDFFRITAKKGQAIVAEVESARLGSGVLPQLRVTDAKKRLIASDDSQSLAGDGRVRFTAPADGDYVIELSDSRYRGGAPPFYRLRITEQQVVGEVFPLGGRRGQDVTHTLRGGSLAKPVSITRKLSDGPFAGLTLFSPDGGMPIRLAAGDLPEITRKDADGELTITPPLLVNGRLAKEGQTDKVRFPVSAGQRWRFAVEAESLGSRLDGVLQIADEKGRVLLEADDVDLPNPSPGQQPIRTTDPSGELTVQAGVKELVVGLRDQRERGGVGFAYRLAIEPAKDDFSLSLPAAEVNVPRGGAATLAVPVVRRGYVGPIALAVPQLPPAYRVKGGRVLEGGTFGVLTIEADDKAGDPVHLAIEARAKMGGKEVRRAVPVRVQLARESGAAGLYALPKLAVATTSAPPFTIIAPASVTLVKGYPAEVTVKFTRSKGQEKLPLQVTAVVPGPNAGPTGFANQNVPPVTTDEAKVRFTAGVNAPEGEADMAIQAQARVGNQLVATSASVPLVVKPPFVMSLDGPLELKPNETVKLTGKLTREDVFKEPVRLTLTGLPPGVTLTAPKPVAAGESAFALELKVGPKPGPVAGKVELAAAATIAGQNYNHRPVVVIVK